MASLGMRYTMSWGEAYNAILSKFSIKQRNVLSPIIWGIIIVGFVFCYSLKYNFLICCLLLALFAVVVLCLPIFWLITFFKKPEMLYNESHLEKRALISQGVRAIGKWEGQEFIEIGVPDARTMLNPMINDEKNRGKEK